MDRNEFLLAVFLIFLAVNVSGASISRNSRKFADGQPNANSTATKTDQPQSPVSNGNRSGPNPIDPDKLEKEKPKDTPVPVNNSSKTDSNGTEDESMKTNMRKEEDKNGNKASPATGKYGSCDGSAEVCADPKIKMITCILSFENGSKVLVIQNEGENTLKVNLTVLHSGKNASKDLVISKHQTTSEDILSTGSSKLVLKGGNKDCVFEILSPKGNFIQWLPHSELLKPIYGAYFLLVTALVIGGTWACCKFRKRRHQEGVPYQELEMGLPESSLAANVETAAGWDEGWDDDWDESKAVKSPGGRFAGNISYNGLTSRSSYREGWENWDD